MDFETVLKWVVVGLIVVGALNWGLIGAFNFNLVTALFGDAMVTRVIYILIGLAGVYKIFMIATKK